MYIDKQTYKVKGKTYSRILLRNSYRKDGKCCHDTIANLSKCDKQEIEAIKIALANKNTIKKLNIPGEKVESKQGLVVGAVWVLYQLAKKLGIVKALGRNENAKLSLWMVIASLIGSVSRLSATRLAQRHAACDILGLDSFCEDNLYKSLDWLADNKNKIEDRLFNSTYKDKKPNIFLYDVTSSYFEGTENELSDYGYNRDGKKGKKQIVIGLLTDDKGRPISCEVFKGNTRDTKTFKNQIDKVSHRFGVEKVTFIGDKGMIMSGQIKDIEAEDYHYITSITKPQIQTLLNNGIIQLSLFDKTVCEVEYDGIKYIYRKNPIRAEEIKKVRQCKYDTLVMLCEKKTKYLAEHAKAKPLVAKNEIIAKAKKLKIDKWVSITADLPYENI